jgi:hypothetical protein
MNNLTVHIEESFPDILSDQGAYKLNVANGEDKQVRLLRASRSPNCEFLSTKYIRD